MRRNLRVLCPCVRRKFVDWDILAAMLGLLGVAWAKAVLVKRSTKNNYHGEGYCMYSLNYKGKEVGGCELKLHRITADKKLRKVRWSLLSETGQKSDSMFATIIRTAFKNWGGGVYLKRIHNKITKPKCYHYCYYATDNETCGQILALTLSAVCI